MLAKFKNFHSLSVNDALTVVIGYRVARYEKIKAGDVLFRRGEKGSTFYITISGTVEVRQRPIL